MIFDFLQKKIKVFIAETEPGMEEKRERLVKVLDRAGMITFQLQEDDLKNKDTIIKKTKALIEKSDCSIHLLGTLCNETNIQIDEIPIPVYQYNMVQKLAISFSGDYKIFIWLPEYLESQIKDLEQENFIRSIKQSINHHMILLTKNSEIYFVEDIRSLMFSGKKQTYTTHKTDLFFIYNELDEESANNIVGMLADVVELRKLEIVLSDNIDYSGLIIQQIEKSKMVVIYFKNTADWAIPFVKEVWKKMGGASSKVPILLIGDANNEANHEVKYEAPNVIYQLVADEIMPIEIKVQYDTFLTV